MTAKERRETSSFGLTQLQRRQRSEEKRRDAQALPSSDGNRYSLLILVRIFEWVQLIIVYLFVVCVYYMFIASVPLFGFCKALCNFVLRKKVQTNKVILLLLLPTYCNLLFSFCFIIMIIVCAGKVTNACQQVFSVYLFYPESYILLCRLM